MTGQAVVFRSDRAAVRVSGPDRLIWLDGLLTQRVSDLNAGESREGLVLSPQGRVEFQVGVIDDGDVTLLVTSSERATALHAFLDGMIFRENVEVSPATNLAVIGCMAGPALEALRVIAPDSTAWHDPWREEQAGGYRYSSRADSDDHWTYVEVLVDSAAVSDIRSRLGANDIAEVNVDALTALRVAAWRPDLEAEGDATLIPHEVDWLRSAVHLTKGCYRGQETVAKVHNLGAPPRRLVLLDLDGVDDALPEPGAEVREGDTTVGRVTSVARHFEEGPIALALIKRGCSEDALFDVAVDGGSVRAAQVVIVPADAGHVADVPRLGSLKTRLGPAV